MGSELSWPRVYAFLAALVAAVRVPISAFVWWIRASDSGLRAVLLHVVSCLAVLALPLAVSAVLSRAAHPWRLEADDAMGVGIDFLLLLGISVASVAVMLGASALRWHRR